MLYTPMFFKRFIQNSNEEKKANLKLHKHNLNKKR